MDVGRYFNTTGCNGRRDPADVMNETFSKLNPALRQVNMGEFPMELKELLSDSCDSLFANLIIAIIPGASSLGGIVRTEESESLVIVEALTPGSKKASGHLYVGISMNT
ncbi:putative MSS4 protein [Colletotrichum sp. SAR 10_75]|nr:putative MSS4 protein [Colletotrichum sp. SAR 10_75]